MLSQETLKLIAALAIFVAGTVGSGLPMVFANREGSHRAELIVNLMNCVATGVILSTAMMHMLDDAGGDLKQFSAERSIDPASPYPFALLFAMIGALLTFIMSTEMNYLGSRMIAAEDRKNITLPLDPEHAKRRNALIRLSILEVAIAVHSIVIGLALGVSDNRGLVKTLAIALSVHQALEGMAVGSLVVESHVPPMKALFFVVTFASTAPLGVLVGLRMQGHVSKVLQGILSAFGAGILLESGFVEMLPVIIPRPTPTQKEIIRRPTPTQKATASSTTSTPTDTEQPKLRNENGGSQQTNDEMEGSNSIRTVPASPSTTYGTVELGTTDVTSSDDTNATSMRLMCYAALFVGAGAQAFVALWA